MGTDSSRSRRGWSDRLDQMRYPLEAPALVVAAIKRARCDDVVPGPIAAPLELLTRSLDREARLNRAGRRAARELLVTCLTERAQWLGGPSRRDAPPTAPPGPPTATSAAAPPPAIVVTGLPGSGAERIAAALTGERADPDQPANRAAPGMTATDQSVADQSVADQSVGDEPVPDQPALGSADEWVTALGLMSWRFDLWWHVPAYAEWLADTDGDAAYQLLTDALAALPEPRPAPDPHPTRATELPRDADGHPILVSPQHLAYLPALRQHLPQALILRVNADPERTAHATAEVAIRQRSAWSDHVDHDVVRRYWAWRTGSITAQSFADTPIGSESVIDVTADTPWPEIADAVDRWRNDSVR